jgi:deazaflavin-dependent oxidoreductase (nitroreductase family)
LVLYGLFGDIFMAAIRPFRHVIVYPAVLREGEREWRLVYAREGDDYLVVASNGGADRPPAWLHNVQASPDVEMQVGRRRRKGTATVVEPSDPGYDRLWKIVNENNRDRYSAYQQQTSRPIPVIVLRPA